MAKKKAKEVEKSITEQQSVFSKLAPGIEETLQRYYDEREDYKGKWFLLAMLNTFQDAAHYDKRVRESFPEIETYTAGGNVYVRYL